MSGWTTKKLGEVCESISTRGCQIQQNEICDIGKFPVVSQSEAFIEGYTDFENAIENIPVVLFGDHTCCVKYIDFPFVVGADGTKLLTAKQFEVKFLYYAILKISSSLVDGKYRRHFKDLKKCDIPIPPLAEQKRIVAKIDVAFEKIDSLKTNAEKNLANAKELFQSALDEAMRPKKGWVEKRLGEVCSKIGSGATPRGGKTSYCSKGISLIRSMNVYDCAFEYSELAHINDMQAKELANVTIEANDVLINITGASVARCCVVPSDVMPARVNQHVAILRIADNRFLNPDFLCYSLVAPARKSLLLGIGEAGSTRQALTKTDLSLFKIKIPDIFEQKRIVERVKVVAQANEALQQNYERQVADCAEMRQAILREAFGGRP